MESESLFGFAGYREKWQAGSVENSWYWSLGHDLKRMAISSLTYSIDGALTLTYAILNGNQYLVMFHGDYNGHRIKKRVLQKTRKAIQKYLNDTNQAFQKRKRINRSLGKVRTVAGSVFVPPSMGGLASPIKSCRFRIRNKASSGFEHYFVVDCGQSAKITLSKLEVLELKEALSPKSLAWIRSYKK